MKEPESQKNDWHWPFAETLQWDLIPVGVDVLPETRVMNKPPRIDILIIRQQETGWTPQQTVEMCHQFQKN